jgi:uncharacterized protein (TIGR02466 family)
VRYCIEELFPTPIYWVVMDDISKIQSEIGTAISNIEFNGSQKTWGKSVDVTNLLGDIIKEQNMVSFEETVDLHLQNYCREIGFQFKEYTRASWLTKTEKNNYTHVHDHSHTDISGCYYYQTNREDGNIFFMTPTTASSSYCFQKYAERWDHKPIVGKLLLFPSYLLHGVKTNITDSTRISLSFSVSFKR